MTNLLCSKGVRLIAIHEIAPPVVVLLLHLFHCSFSHLVTMFRKAILPHATADVLESHQVPRTKICVITTFPAIAPSRAMSTMTMIFRQWGISFAMAHFQHVSLTFQHTHLVWIFSPVWALTFHQTDVFAEHTLDNQRHAHWAILCSGCFFLDQGS